MTEQLNIVGTYSLIFNAALMAADGIGFVLGLDNILNLTEKSTLCFRPLEPRKTAQMNVVWKRYQMMSRQAEAFCGRLGADSLTGSRVALCIEEIAGNVVSHGFRPGKKNLLSIRLAKKENQWILRFRDDCRSFDPVSYTPREGKDALGIRVVMAMADDIRYTYSLNLNNLTIKMTPKPE